MTDLETPDLVFLPFLKKPCKDICLDNIFYTITNKMLVMWFDFSAQD